eukprot:TRINITY_DN1389_c0_g1_i1.p1 TRINITY_DN1389_c0_g1~~TRINITY_DN1389_c0_g1_i1.p1  ORF type:complete len:405 (-),score=56.14 TRINITY_DN1389_c0_g1_i1:298-1512(-)
MGALTLAGLSVAFIAMAGLPAVLNLGEASVDLKVEDMNGISIAFTILIVAAPSLVILWAVFSQSKLVSAFAQLSDVGVRDSNLKTMTHQAVQVDETWFILGVTNTALTPYILGAYPAAYFLYYTPKTLCLILLRFVSFKQKKQHFLLWDFCYWANFLCIFYCWVQPTSPFLFRVMFMCANGPLAFSVLAFNHALIFHSFAHITSVVVHTSPLILSYGLRWYAAPLGHGFGADRFQVCDDGPDSCLQVPVLQLITDAMKGFYLWWIVIYYVLIFVALGSYIEQRGYQTLWDRILQMKPIGPLLKKMLQRFPKLLVQLVYLLIHLVFSTLTMFVACVLWYYQTAHFLFLMAITLATVKNAAVFYFEIFETTYEMAARGSGDGQSSLSKKLLSASPGLAQLKQPLGC